MKKALTLLVLSIFVTTIWAQDHIITVTNNVFTPADITITAGETIEWQNTQGNHNVNGTQASFPNNPEDFGNMVGAGWTFQHTFNTAGAYDYQCDPHVGFGMVGTITVNPASTGGVTDIVITEIMYNPPESGQDSLEFIELFNSGSAAVNVGGLYFTQGVEDTLPSMMLGAGEYLIVAANAVAFQNAFGIAAEQWDGGSLSNGGEDIELVDAAGNVIDFVLYDDNTPWPTAPDGNGASIELCDPASDNNDPTNWKESFTPTGIVVNGLEIIATPGAASACPTGPIVSMIGSSMTVGEDAGTVTVQLALEGGDANATTVDITLGGTATGGGMDYMLGSSATVTFTAGMAIDTQTVSIDIIDDADVESIETISFSLGNATNAAVINPSFPSYEITIQDNDAAVENLVITEIMYNPPEGGTDTTEYIEILNNGTAAVDLDGYFFSAGVDFTFPAMMLQPGEYTVITGNAAAYQAYYGTTVLQWDAGALGNGGETIALSNSGGTIVDEVTYDDDVAAGWPTSPDGSGPSLILCDVNADNNIATNWGAGTTSTGVVIGGFEILASPGAANTCGSTGGPTYPPYAVGVVTGDSDMNGLPDSLGVTTEITGVVYGIDLNGGDALQFTLIDANNDGIGIFEGDPNAYVVNEGDEITIRGTINHFNGLAQIAPDEITFNTSGNALFDPTVVTTLDESTESQLVKMLSVSLVDPTQWDNSNTSGFNVDITDGTNTFLMRIDNEVDLYNMPAPVGLFNLTGIGGQFDSSDPYDSGYQILPRYTADIEPIVGTNDLELGTSIRLFPNPVNELLQLQMEKSIDVIRVYNVLGQQMLNLRQPNDTEEISVNNWQSGVYTISFVSGEKVFTTQFVKQ